MGARRSSAPSPQPCLLCQLGRSAPRPRRTDGPKRASGGCIVQRESLLGQPTTAPTRLGSGMQRKPFSNLALRSPEGKAGQGFPCSLGPVSLLGVSDARNPLPTGSPCLGSRIGRAKPFCAQAAAMPPEPARLLSAEALSHLRPKTSFWQLHCAKGKSPRAANNSPNAPRLRQATQAVFAPALRSPEGKAGRGCPWLPGPCSFAGDHRCPKPTPHGFSLAGKQDWAREGLLRPGRSHAP